MKKTILATAMVAALASTGTSVAGTLEDEVAAIKARLEAVEQQLQDTIKANQEKDRKLAEQEREIAELKSGGGTSSSGGGWFQGIEVGGLIEVEAGYNDSDESGADSESDIYVPTVEIGIAAQVNDWVGAEVVLLYEEAFGNDSDEDTDLEIDVATITIADPDGPWFVTSGRQYVPFGTYETNLISDPLTLEIGETRESAILAGMESNGFAGGVYIFNGDIDEDGDNDIDSFGAFAGYSHENENVAFAVNGGYISNIADSDGLQDTINDNIDAVPVDFDDHVGGFTVDAMVETGPFVFIAEYTTATDDFTSDELAFRGDGAEPSAFNIEAGYNFMLAGRDATVAIAYQETDEAVGLGLPEERVAAAISVEIMDSTTLSFEWANDDDYSTADGGTGEAGGDTVTGQLAVEF